MMKTSLLLIVAFSSLIFASPVNIVRETVEAREISLSLFERGDFQRRGVSFERISGGARDGAAGANLGQGMMEVIEKIHSDDDNRRIKFVHDSLAKYGKKHPGFQIIVVHKDDGYDKNFAPGWGMAHEEVPIHIGGGSKGYDIFWFKKGTFNLHGDAGWINWGYTGKPKREGNRLTYT